MLINCLVLNRWSGSYLEAELSQVFHEYWSFMSLGLLVIKLAFKSNCPWNWCSKAKTHTQCGALFALLLIISCRGLCLFFIFLYQKSLIPSLLILFGELRKSLFFLLEPALGLLLLWNAFEHSAVQNAVAWFFWKSSLLDQRSQQLFWEYELWLVEVVGSDSQCRVICGSSLVCLRY